MNPFVNAALTKLTWSVTQHIHIEILVFKSTTLFPESQLPEHNQSPLHLDLGNNRRRVQTKRKINENISRGRRDQLVEIKSSKRHTAPSNLSSAELAPVQLR